MASSFFSIARSSEGAYDLDDLEFITVKSAAVKGRVDLCTYRPAEAEGGNDIPIVILLHGVTGSCWAWASHGGAHRVLENMMVEGQSKPMILAMPSDGLRGCGSGYLPISPDKNYEAWIVEELPRLMRELYSEVSENSPVFIAGLSMGGYGALRLGAKYPEVFAGLSGHSSITTFQGIKPYIQESLNSLGSIAPDEGDVLPWLVKNRTTLPPFRFDCGKEDALISANRELHQVLVEQDIPHDYSEFSGAHTLDYWSEHLHQTLEFFNQQLT
jgi:putative tributyrin esterase